MHRRGATAYVKTPMARSGWIPVLVFYANIFPTGLRFTNMVYEISNSTTIFATTPDGMDIFET